MAGLIDLYEKWDEGEISDSELADKCKAIGFGQPIILRQPAPQPPPSPHVSQLAASGISVGHPAFSK